MKIKEFWFIEMGFNCFAQGFDHSWKNVMAALKERMIHETQINTVDFLNQEVEDE